MPNLNELMKAKDAQRQKTAAQAQGTVEAKKDAEPIDINKSNDNDFKSKAALEEKEKIEVDSYNEVKIYRVEGKPNLIYELQTVHYRGEEKALITSLIEIATKIVEEKLQEETPHQRKQRFFNKILEIIQTTPELKVPINAREFYAQAVAREMAGFGLIDPLLEDDELEEVMIVGPNKPVYVFHRKHNMCATNVVFYEDKDIQTLIERIARGIGRHIDVQTPLLDARLADGTRVNATIPPTSIDGSTITIRKFRKDPLTVIDSIEKRTINYEVAAFLWLAVEGYGAKPANILIAGGTASGKTTTLNILSSFVPANERIITIEDTAELALPIKHWIRFETRPPGLEGTGEITMNDLVKNALRMRPDRIIVGEIRGEEGFTLFSAMNTGHDGALGTVHSNSAKETLTRLTSPPINVPIVMLNSLNLIVMQQRINDRRKGLIRRITEVAELTPSAEGPPTVQTLYQWNAATDEIIQTTNKPHFLSLLSKFTGLELQVIEKEIQIRAKILKEIKEKGIRSFKEVGTLTQAYSLKAAQTSKR